MRSQVKIAPLHCSRETPSFDHLSHVSFQGTFSVQCGRRLGPGCRFILPSMMMGSSAAVERRRWTILPATSGWSYHAVFRSKLHMRLGAFKYRQVRLNPCFRRSKAKAPARRQPSFTRNASSSPCIVRRHPSYGRSFEDAYGSKTIGTTWCRRPSRGWQLRGRPARGATPAPISTGSYGTSWRIGYELGREASLSIRLPARFLRRWPAQMKLRS